MDGGRRIRPVLASLVLLALVPLLILAVRAGFQHWLPVGDTAVIGLRVAEVGSGHTPLVGPYSHFGWSHPGPLLFYALALPYRLIGSTSDGLLLGAVAINALAVFAIGRVLFRLGGLALATAGLVLFGFAMWTLGASWLWYPWNPNLALLPFAAFLMVAWSVAVGRTWDLPWLVGFGSYLVQTHVAYGLIVVGITALALVCRSGARRVDAVGTATGLAPQTKPLVVSGVLLAVLWLPPAIDALWHDGGNLRALIDFWLGGHSTIGFAHALKLMALALSVHGPWLGFPEPPSFGAGVVPLGIPIPVGLFALLAATVVAHRRRDRVAITFCLLVLVAIAIGVVSLWRIVGPPYDYLVYWTRVIAAATWLAAGWALVRALPGATGTALRRMARVVIIAGGLSLVAVSSWSALHAGVGPRSERASSRELSRVIPSVARQIGPRSTVEIAVNPTFYGGTYSAGLMLALVQKGIRVNTQPADAVRLGSYYTAADPSAMTLRVSAGSVEIQARKDAGGNVIAQSGPTVAVPRPLPASRKRENLFAYLARVRHAIGPARYRQLLDAWSPSIPLAVFAEPRTKR